MSFALFIVLNAVLLIRPEELWPEIEGLRLYLIVISCCLIATAPKIFKQLSPDTLSRRPITVCVLGLLFSVTLSLVVRGKLTEAEEFVPEFAKVILYYLLMVSVINSPERLRTFLGWIVVFVAIIAILGLLQYHEYINIESIKPIVDGRTDPITGERTEILRMRSSGIFNDPNDLCLILVFGSLCCMYRAAACDNRFMAVLWMMPIGLFGYALTCTESRGGLLGLMAGGAGFVYAKYGWKRAMPMTLIGVVALLVVGGRQAQLTGDTAHERLVLWAEGLSELTARPTLLLTGLGAGEYANEIGQVAHNSFIHAYVELGIIGGALFLAAFVYAVWMLFRLDRARTLGGSRSLAACRPIVVAMMIAYSTGCYSLSRNYVIPTYMCLGVATSYLAMTMPDPAPRFRVSELWAKWTVAIGIGGFVFVKLFTQYASVLGL